MAKTIEIGKLKPGMVIIKVTAQNGPVKIKKSGLVSSQDMVKALSEMGVLEVEIDPEITVEMKQPKITKSKTQQLLEDDKILTHDVENDISEQFNRNLFLPSVQELPEAWQYYGKKIAVIFIVILGGLGSGWSISQFPVWSQAFSANTAQTPQTTIPQPVKPVEMQVVDAETAQGTAEKALPEVVAPELVNPEPGSKEPEPIVAQVAEPIVTEPEVEPEAQSNISPELLKRFQDAVESLDARQADNNDNDLSGNSDYQNEILRDITPVHELSARTLTRLPSMAFSTHMYASDPQDRWVRVNGRRVTEGQEIDRGLVLIGIEPQHVILDFEGKEFRMDALTDW